MKKVLKLLFVLFTLTLEGVQANSPFSLTERDSCEISRYRLNDLQTVFGKAGLKLADLNIPYPMDGLYMGSMRYFRIEVKQLSFQQLRLFQKREYRS